MSDIVERLRTRPTGDPYLHMMVHEAADEIERLRAEVAGLREAISAALPYCYYMDLPDGGDVELPEQLRRMGEDAARYIWLCANNFDREGPTQIHTWLHTWEPHSKTGEPTAWMQRIYGGKLDAAIDAARKGEA